MSTYRITVTRLDPVSNEERKAQWEQVRWRGNFNSTDWTSIPATTEAEALTFLADEEAFAAIRSAALAAMKPKHDGLGPTDGAQIGGTGLAAMLQQKAMDK